MTRRQTQTPGESRGTERRTNMPIRELQRPSESSELFHIDTITQLELSSPKVSEHDADPEEPSKKKGTACICTDLLIPGRGDPTKDAAVIIEEGKVAFAGLQDQIPQKYASIPRVQVPVLMPGLWDCHTHFSGGADDATNYMLGPAAACGARIARAFYETLMAGFTTIRDVGSYALEASQAVEEGLIYGPNVYCAGACISQTAGHGDSFDVPVGWVWRSIGVGINSGGDNPGTTMICIADGVDECRKAVRLQIRRGAKLIKVLASGGVMSRDDDPKFQQFSDEELKVMVDEAGRMNRIVAAHVHGKPGILAALRAGVRTLEHGTYLDDECIDIMKEKGVMLIATRYIVAEFMKRLDLLPPKQRAKMITVSEVHRKAYAHAVKSGVKCALGTDLGSSDPRAPLAHGTNGAELAYAVEAGMTPLEAIEAATANGPDTLGPMAPKSGQIKLGYDADLIALAKNPLDDIEVFKDVKNITHVWKGGKLSKGPGISAMP